MEKAEDIILFLIMHSDGPRMLLLHQGSRPTELVLVRFYLEDLSIVAL